MDRPCTRLQGGAHQSTSQTQQRGGRLAHHRLRSSEDVVVPINDLAACLTEKRCEALGSCGPEKFNFRIPSVFFIPKQVRCRAVLFWADTMGHNSGHKVHAVAQKPETSDMRANIRVRERHRLPCTSVFDCMGCVGSPSRSCRSAGQRRPSCTCERNTFSYGIRASSAVTLWAFPHNKHCYPQHLRQHPQ